MRTFGTTCLVCIMVGLFGCDQTRSPRLEKIRPHLKPGVNRTDLVHEIGLVHTPGNLDEMVASKRFILTYEMDGAKEGMRLKLAFANNQLTSAVVVKPDADGDFTEVDEVIVAEPGR